MSLKVKNSSGDLIPISLLKFDDVEKVFSLGVDDKELILQYPIQLSKEHPPEEFEIYQLTNTSLNAESDIFQVYEEELGGRIGWIFPIQSIMSNDHKKSNDKFFLNYAYVAYNLLLQGEVHQDKTISLEKALGECSLYDFYDDDIIVFVISKNTLPVEEEFDIKNYITSLSKYGYYLSDNKRKVSLNESIVAKEYYERYKGEPKLNIQKISGKYRANTFIQELYINLLYGSKHHLLIFHYLYQVVEFLIEENFKIEFDELIEEYRQSNISRMDFREKIGDALREKKRINNINEIVKPDGRVCQELQDECNRLLAIIDDPKVNYVEALYRVRSLMVHEYRKIIQDEERVRIVESINLRFKNLINEILIKDK